jgi:hypothetical protein
MMAEDNKQPSGGLPAALPLMAVLAILAGWFFSYPAPYQEERPSSHPLQILYPSAQDVEARLWQDPFAAVDDARVNPGKITFTLDTKYPVSLSDANSHGWGQIYFEQNHENITILAIILPGGSYQEAVEQRMRWRYAVLSALANQDITPKDEQHIGYVQPEPEMDLQKILPFEWWSRPEDKGDVLLLWVDELSLRNDPAKKLKELLSNASPSPANVPNQIQYKVIGPNSSTILRVLLRDLLKEVKADKNHPSAAGCTENPDVNEIKDTLGRIKGHGTEYFSAGATASDGELLNGMDEQMADVSKFLCKLGVKLNRTTATDDKMMEVIIKELQFRQLCLRTGKDNENCTDPKKDKEDHVVILSEWDTFYGQAMPKAFETVWDNNGSNKNNVHKYSYMRGLDGSLPDKGDKASNGAEKKSDSKDKPSAEALIELPEGQNQKDYLRRLTANILELDQDLKDKGNKKGVAAIGVLGSDVHDKLMVLEALRQYFPHKLFFTTDLDAAYSHPAKLPQTHNLLVASAFDLKLRPELQGKIPPFRDSYQTALFLATQMPLKNGMGIVGQIDMHLPRLFEVGRSHAISLPTSEDNVLPKNTDDNCWTDLTKCYKNVQPPLVAAYQFNWTGRGVFAVLLVALTPLFISWSIRKIWKEYLGCIFVVIILASLFLKLWWNHYISQDYAEPFYWFEGVSAWPSQLLRLLALLFAGGFYWWGHKRIQKMQLALQARPSSHNHETIFALPVGLSGVSGWNALFVGNWKEKYDDEGVSSPDLLWKKYLGYCRPKSTIYRILAHSLVFVAIALLIRVCSVNRHA